MTAREVSINGWSIVFLFYYDASDWERVERALSWADAPEYVLRKVERMVDRGRLDEGFTFSNPDERKTVFGIGETSSGPEVLDSTVHEIIHIVQHIAMEDGMDMFSEDVAYLGGDVSRTISDIVCELSCPHCHG